MPVIAQIIIPVRFNKGTVEILRERFNSSDCGCLNLVTEAKQLETPIEVIRQSIYGLDGVVCQGDNCCISDVQSLVEKLKKFREDA
jgi:hypothetical protein